MYWCKKCQEYIEPDYNMTYTPLGAGRCPTCHLTVSGNHERPISEYQNNGIHNVSEFNLPVGAAQTPVLDALLAEYHILKHNEQNDPNLAYRREEAWFKVRAYLLQHTSLCTVVNR